MNAAVELTYDLDLGPGELRGLAWVSAQHPNTLLSLSHVRDEADCGWIVARARVKRGGRMTLHDYWCSSTGRVFKGEPPWNNSYFSRRTDEELRPADYAKPVAV